MSLLSHLRRAMQTAPTQSSGTRTPSAVVRTAPLPEAGSQADYDQRAIERYRYLLHTASPEHLEQVHAEAFARLTPDQRRQVLDRLAEDTAMTTATRDALAEDTRGMAREATRWEIRRPGTMERILGETSAGTGRAVAGGLLAGVAGVAAGALLLDGLVDTGFGDGGLIDTGHAGSWPGAIGGGPDGEGWGGLDLGAWFD